jgi:hypothetical protein
VVTVGGLAARLVLKHNRRRSTAMSGAPAGAA